MQQLCRAVRHTASAKTGPRARMLEKRMRHILCQYAHKSLMDLHVQGMPASPLHAKHRDKSDWTDRAITPLPPVPDSDASHEHLLSRIDPLPQLQTLRWIPRGLDCRCAAVRLKALDRAMQTAKANAAAPTQRLWSNVALLIPHLILWVAPGHKHREEGLGSIRDEIRKKTGSCGETKPGTA